MEDILKAHKFATRLYSGKYIQINLLQKSDICLSDIAHALAFKPRFNGNGKSWYSIARHSIAVSHLVQPQYKLSALLHDASEAYLFDIPKPMKEMQEFKDIVLLEDKIQSLVYDKYLIEEKDRLNYYIKNADFIELQREWNLTMLNGELSSNPKEDEREFIRLFMIYSEYLFRINPDMEKEYTRNGIVKELDKLKQIFNIINNELYFTTN